MGERRRATYFIKFHDLACSSETKGARQDHLAWFKARDLLYEVAAPSGWLEGDPGCYAVYFDDENDHRIGEYASTFEDSTGRSLHPEQYQMYLRPYEGLLRSVPERS